MAVVGEPLRWMVGTEALRVETEEAKEARLDSLRPREMLERFLPCQPVSMHLRRGLWPRKPGACSEVANADESTHCAREFFLEDEADWMGTPSSPIEPRDTICLPNRFAAASLGSTGSLEVDGELLMSSASQECAD